MRWNKYTQIRQQSSEIKFRVVEIIIIIIIIIMQRLTRRVAVIWMTNRRCRYL